MLRVAEYVRMSSEKQEDSPERQRAAIVPYIERQGWNRVASYEDLGERGWDTQRSGFRRMLADAERGLFDVIVIDEVSRLSRSDQTEFDATVAYPLRRAGVKVAVVADNEVVDFADDDLGRSLTRFIKQYKASQESKDTARRVANDTHAKAGRAAIQVGKPPYGYRRVKDDSGARLVLGPENEVSTVRFIFKSYVERDMSLCDIARKLEERGTLTPSGKTVWKPNQILKMLRDETYIGSYVFGRRTSARYKSVRKSAVVESPNVRGQNPRQHHNNPREEWFIQPNHHEAIIDTETFRAAQEARQQKRRRTKPIQTREGFLLAGLLRCGDCGGSMCGLRGGHRRKPGYSAYRCSGHINTGRCRSNITEEQPLREAILTTLRQSFLSAEFLATVRQRAREADERSASESNLSRLRAEAQTLEANIAKAKRKLSLLDEDLLPPVVADIRAWTARLADVESEIAQAGEPRSVSDLEEVIAEVEKMIADFDDALLDGDNARLRVLLRERIAFVAVYNEATAYGKGRYHYRLTGGKIVLTKGGGLNAMMTEESIRLFITGPGDEQRNAWSVGFLAG